MEFPSEVRRVAVAGDWHGNYNYVPRALNYAYKQGAEVVVHVGDFGYWREPDGYLDMVERFCQTHNMIVMFVDGNHENHDLLNSVPIDEDGVRRIRDHLWHLPRGFRWEWGLITFLALGGAVSVDAHLRTPGIDWWDREALSIQDAYKAVEGGIVDVIFSHDCPSGVGIPGIDESASRFPDYLLHEAQEHRNLLRKVVDETKPLWLYHGHYHCRYSTVLIGDGYTTEIVGLDKDFSPFENNMIILTL